jgi:hypothetical protein
MEDLRTFRSHLSGLSIFAESSEPAGNAGTESAAGSAGAKSSPTETDLTILVEGLKKLRRTALQGDLEGVEKAAELASLVPAGAGSGESTHWQESLRKIKVSFEQFNFNDAVSEIDKVLDKIKHEIHP